jgi:hypothetical protein
MADWLHFTPESVRTWPMASLLEAKRDISRKLGTEARYESNAADMRHKVSVLTAEIQRRKHERA